MTNIDIINNIIETHNASQWYPILFNKYKDIYDDIILTTNYLPHFVTLSERIYHIKHKLSCVVKCSDCNQLVKFISFNKGYSKFCSVKCAKNNSSNKEKYKSTCIEKYGVINSFQLEGVKDKIKNTLIERYGESNISKLESNKKKVKNTMISRYGDWYTKTNDYRQKTRNTCQEKYGVDNHIQLVEFKDKRSFDIYEKYQHQLSDNLIISRNTEDNNKCNITCKECNRIQSIYWGTFYEYIDKSGCLLCNYLDSSSRGEIEVRKFIESLGVDNIIIKTRKILDSKKELDIYLPDYNLAIEYNGLYWHSTKILSDNRYHVKKLDECNSKGIKLIQIFEDEWTNKQDIVKSKIKHLLGKTENKYHARKCSIKQINNITKKEFLNDNHIQGSDICKLSFGAFIDSELIGVMTFSNFSKSKGRNKIENCFELSRFCIKKDVSCCGLFSKMFKYFIDNYHPDNIITYADRRWSEGKLYESIFEKKGNIKPNYWYCEPNKIKRFHRYTYRKSELKEMKNYNENLTEFEIMDKEGFLRIYDCGNILYEYMRTKNIVYTIGNREFYDKALDGTVPLYKAKGGTVWKDFKTANEHYEKIGGKVLMYDLEVDAGIYEVEANWEKDVINGELINKAKIIKRII